MPRTASASTTEASCGNLRNASTAKGGFMKPTRAVTAVALLWFFASIATSQTDHVPSAGTPQNNLQLWLTYLGTAGWEITDGKTVVLIDPYLTRFKSNTPNDPALPSDPRPLVTRDDFVTSDHAVIDAHVKRADLILITHTHVDHVLDMPYIAGKTGALVIGTESTANFARDNGVPNSQILTVKGGEDLQLPGCSVRVIPSLHGILPNASQFPPSSAIFPADAKPPFRLGQLFIEGGTLAYFIRMAGHQIIVFGSMNYIEREVDGLRPDVALIGAMPERQKIYHYTERLLRSLGYPRLVMPTHWDRFNVPYDVS